MKPNIGRTVLIYKMGDGKFPYMDWFYGLKDDKTKNIIRERITRLRAGNFGDYKSVGYGIFELRINFGPGFRIYYAHDGLTIVILLTGGDKHTQNKDIKKAQEYWADYRRRQYARN